MKLSDAVKGKEVIVNCLPEGPVSQWYGMVGKIAQVEKDGWVIVEFDEYPFRAAFDPAELGG